LSVKPPYQKIFFDIEPIAICLITKIHDDFIETKLYQWWNKDKIMECVEFSE